MIMCAVIHWRRWQILFDGHRTVGVMMQHEGQQKAVEATSEVILAAGTVGTTKLLMLSGVGPRDHLQSLKVTAFSLLTH